ncbi:MAG: A/G-specific adenine glycosylase [Longimicrobiales bacterium]|nr:A/G-specific adenine glycosylase [Longimicrobiales bacterium]
MTPRAAPGSPAAAARLPVARLRRALLDFFRRRRDVRPMPWRATRDPYAIWVSEVMLQQTRVETVVPYYRAWMERFPTVVALAGAREEAVLKQWEGLGYYSRARNLHRAARVVRERHGGVLPGALETLRALPGVGEYTAGAVGSIAFGLPVPAVDGNVRRVVARLLDWPDPAGRPLRDTVAGWVPEDRPGDFNQAFMELGATVCLPRAPRCGECPLAELCCALAAGTVADRPRRKVRAPVPEELHAVTVAVRSGGRWPCLALRKRPSRGLLAGMWEFPSEVLEGGVVAKGGRAGGASAPAPGDGSPLPEVRHAFTHLRVIYRPVLARLPAGSPPPAGCRWLTPAEVGGLPLPAAQRSIVESALAALEAAEITD